MEEVEGCPKLVVSDFGECVYVEDGQDLCIPYVTEEINKGGNDALRAPEVRYGNHLLNGLHVV